MDKDKQETEVLQEELRAEVESTHFEYGNLIRRCLVCGAESVLDEQIQTGIQFSLLTNTESFLNLKCTECNSGMELRFVECEAPEPKEVKEGGEIEHVVTEEDVALNPGEELQAGEEIVIEQEAIADENVQEEDVKTESV